MLRENYLQELPRPPLEGEDRGEGGALEVNPHPSPLSQREREKSSPRPRNRGRGKGEGATIKGRCYDYPSLIISNRVL
jgi:hypothetical protein